MSLRAACAVALLALAACGGSDKKTSSSGSATMRPGENCNTAGCHSFTAAGTVYLTSTSTSAVNNATVTVDGSAASLTLHTNTAGNFYTSQYFGTSASLSVNCGGATKPMVSAIGSSSGCGSCHGSSQPRIYCP